VNKKQQENKGGEKLLEERYVTVKEVAAYYGVKPQTVWKWIREGKIPAYRIGRGRNYRLKLSELPKQAI
jgi:excisionase family DNA binding protein